MAHFWNHFGANSPVESAPKVVEEIDPDRPSWDLFSNKLTPNIWEEIEAKSTPGAQERTGEPRGAPRSAQESTGAPRSAQESPGEPRR